MRQFEDRVPALRPMWRIVVRALRSRAANCALAIACVGAAFGAAQATELDEGLTACAVRDLQLVTLIEHHGDQQTIASERLAEAYFTMMKARNACREGRIAEALRIYDAITLGPVLTHRTQ